jgi:exosortase O
MLTKTQTTNIPWQISKGSLGGIGLAIWWFYLNIFAMEWLFVSLQKASLFNLVLFSAVIGGLGILGFYQRHQLSFSLTPQWERSPVCLLLGSGIGALALRWLLDIPQLSIIVFLIGTYGLFGLFINSKVWRSGLVVAILFACIFPFSLEMSVGVGLPIRVMTAYAVEHLLTNWGLPATSSHDIILLEGRVAYVDLPCSGLKSLWTGTLFLLAATWLENRKINLRWFGVLLVHIALLIAANIGRVMMLVLINNVLKQPELAQIVHFPLGIVGFSSACFISWCLLQRLDKNSHNFEGWNFRKIFSRKVPSVREKQRLITSVPTQNNYLTKVAVGLCLVGLVLIPQPSEVSENVVKLDRLSLPSAIQTQTLPLTGIENQFFANHPQTIARKQRFKVGNLSGSFLLVSTNSWQSHHAPELCLTGNGVRVDEMTKKQLTADVTGRWLSLNSDRANAAYWFQSPHRTTDEFLDRLWSDITRQEKSWTLVSVLFDNPVQSDTPEVKTLVNDLHQSLVSLS